MRFGRIRRFALRMLGVTGDLTDEAFWAALSGVQSTAGQTVSAQTMLQLSTVWACTRLISETIATLPLAMHERSSGGKRPAPQHWLHGIIHDAPNPESTASVHWESTVAAMLLRGNARAEKLMIGKRVVGLRFLAPDRLRISRRADGLLEYRYTEATGSQREIPPERIWNVPGFALDGVTGVSVVTHGANVFGAAMAADQAASATFKNGLLPTTYFKLERVLTPQQRTEFRESLKEISGSLNAGKSPLLEGGMTVGGVGINPNDAQLLESRAFSVEEICRWFRVPPFMVGHAEKSTSWGTGIEQQMIGFLAFTLGPWLRRIEQAISKDLLSPAERARYYPKFAVEGLLRADSAGRASYYGSMVNNGIFTRDEVRELEDREPMGGNASVLTVQTAMAPLDSIAQSGGAAAARAALRSWLAEPEPERNTP